MQTTRFNGMQVKDCPHRGSRWITFSTSDQVYEGELWKENEDIALYKMRGRRMIVAINLKTTVRTVVDCETGDWDKDGSKYRYAQQIICLRHGLEY